MCTFLLEKGVTIHNFIFMSLFMNIQLISNMYCNIIAVRVMKDIQRKNEAKQSSQKEVMSKSVILCKLSTTFDCNCICICIYIYMYIYMYM